MSRGRTAGLVAALIAFTLVAAGCGAGDPGADPSPLSRPVSSVSSASTGPSARPTDRTGHPTTGAPSAASSAPARSGPARPSITIPDLPTAQDRGIVEGADVSWPNCPKGMGIPQRRSEGRPMPLPSAGFVVLGLTNGPAFHPNPCLADQVAWVKQHHLMAAAYSVISMPEAGFAQQYAGSGPYDASTAEGRLSNLGYAQAAYNLATMRRAGLETPFVWLDVEPVPKFDWPDDPAANAAVVRGAARGYTDAGYQIGVYSLGSMWHDIVGGLRLGVPEWRPAGESPRAEALSRCGPSWMFQGGTAALAQWVDGDRDHDITCPGTSTYLSVWFHQY